MGHHSPFIVTVSRGLYAWNAAWLSEEWSPVVTLISQEGQNGRQQAYSSVPGRHVEQR